MVRAVTPYRSLMSEADLEDMGPSGLLATPRSAPTPVATTALAEQIRRLYGNRGDWNYGGIDRAAELADLLQKQGVTDVSQIQLLRNTRQEMQGLGGESDGATTLVETPINQVQFGDKRIGFAGDYNNDNTFGSKASEYLQGDNTLGWSARGDGNVTYKVGTDAQGNNYLMPEWGSSSDMADVRAMAKAAAVMAAMAYGVPMLGEAAGAAGGTAAAAAPITDAATAAFLEANMGALAPTVSGGFAPVAAASTLAPEVIASTLAPEAAAPSLLSTAAAAAPELATVAPELAGSGLLAPQTITVTGSKAAAATTPWWAPAAVAAPAVPVLGGMTATPTVAEAFRPSQNYGEGMTGAQTSAYDGVINATGSPALANAAANVAGAGSNVVDFVKANPTLGRLLFSGAGALLNTVGGPSGSSPGGYVDSGYRPNISRGGFNAAPQARQMAAQPTGLLMAPGRGEANSGLWRYAGLLDGAAGPSAPQMTPAMTPPMTPAMTPPRVTPPPMRATPPTTVRPALTPAPTTPAVRPAAVTNAATAWKPGGMASWLQTDLTPVQRAVAYNAYRANNMSDAEIRAMADKTFGKQTDTDWATLQRLAAPLPKDLLPAGRSFTDQQLKAVALPYAQPSEKPVAQPAPAVTTTAADAPIGVPYVSPAQRLKNYAYEGGANDDVATRRGLGYARLMGWSPDEAVRNWNEALGTRFTTDDYQRALQAYGFTSGGLLGG